VFICFEEWKKEADIITKVHNFKNIIRDIFIENKIILIKDDLEEMDEISSLKIDIIPKI
jgi:hypothetical protein